MPTGTDTGTLGGTAEGVTVVVTGGVLDDTLGGTTADVNVDVTGTLGVTTFGLEGTSELEEDPLAGEVLLDPKYETTSSSSLLFMEILSYG